MAWWICSDCSYVLEAETPPETCFGCGTKCVFSDVTCYLPGCGECGHLDARLVALKVRQAKKAIRAVQSAR
jgi:rubredoxin